MRRALAKTFVKARSLAPKMERTISVHRTTMTFPNPLRCTSFANAEASNVLPLPEGPYSNNPEGGETPLEYHFSGDSNADNVVEITRRTGSLAESFKCFKVGVLSGSVVL